MPETEVRVASSVATKKVPHFWEHILVPSFRELESFVWKLLWFAVFICLLFSFNPFDWIR